MMVKLPDLPGKMKDVTKEVMDVAGGIAESALVFSEATLERLNQFLEDFNDVLPTINALGLSFEFMEMKFGLPPVVRLNLKGALQEIEEGKIKKLIASKAENKMLIPILQAFRTLALLKKPLGEVGFKGVNVDLSVGVFSSINIEFLK